MTKYSKRTRKSSRLLKPQKRGYQFEKIISQVFTEHGFQVLPNSRVAKPRQTDLFAKDSDHSLLVEIKSVTRKIDVNDIDALRSRLSRASSGIVGAIFVTSGFTKGALKEIEESRSREILAFGPSDVKALLEHKANLKELIDRKEEMLRTMAKVWFFKPTIWKHKCTKLPQGREQFHIGVPQSTYIESITDWDGDLLFVRELPDPGWGGYGGEGTRLTLQLDLSTLEDLARILGLLHEKFGLTEGGRFAIHQTGISWFGSGANNFVEAAEQWVARYEKSSLSSFHHSEDLQFFDSLREGWLLLTTRQRINYEKKPHAWLHSSQLTIQLSGIPLDIEPFLQLCKYTNNQEARFQFITNRHTVFHRLKEPILLEVKGQIIDHRDDVRSRSLVSGIVAKNPFFGKNTLPDEFSHDKNSPLIQLNTVESLLCSLNDWHEEGDIVDEYALLGFEATWADNTPVIRPFATWKNMLKQANHGDVSTEFEELLKMTNDGDAVRDLLDSLGKGKRTKGRRD